MYIYIYILYSIIKLTFDSPLHAVWLSAMSQTAAGCSWSGTRVQSYPGSGHYRILAQGWILREACAQFVPKSFNILAKWWSFDIIWLQGVYHFISCDYFLSLTPHHPLTIIHLYCSGMLRPSPARPSQYSHIQPLSSWDVSGTLEAEVELAKPASKEMP